MLPEVALPGNIFLQLLLSPAHILPKCLQLFGGRVPLSEEGVAEDAQPVVLPTGLFVRSRDRHSIGSNEFFGVGHSGCRMAACHEVVVVRAGL